MHDVLLADRDATRRQEEVDFPPAARNDRSRLLRIVWQDADHLGAEAHLPQSARESVEVAVVDLAGAQRLTRQHELIARARNRDARTAEDLDRAESQAREHAEMCRRELRATLDSPCPLADILARKAVVLVMVELVRHKNAAILHRDIFLAHDAVTALWDGRARHQAHSRARWHFCREEIPGTLLADDREGSRCLLRRPLRAGGRKGVAVERRAVERRIVKCRDSILSEDAPERLQERHLLDGFDFLRVFEQDRDGLLQRNILHEQPRFTSGRGRWDSGRPRSACRGRRCRSGGSPCASRGHRQSHAAGSCRRSSPCRT